MANDKPGLAGSYSQNQYLEGLPVRRYDPQRMAYIYDEVQPEKEPATDDQEGVK